MSAIMGSPPEQQGFTFDRVARMLFSTLALVFVVLLLRYLSDVLLPFAGAVVLAYLLNPLVTLFERKTKRRGLAVGMTIGGLGILGVAICATIVPLVMSQASRFGDDLRRLHEDLLGTVPAVAVAEPMDEVSGRGTGEPVPDDVKTSTGWTELMSGWTRFRTEAGTLSRKERFQSLLEAVSGTYIGDLFTQAVEYANTPEFSKLLLETARRMAIGGWTVVAFTVNVILGLTGLIVVLLYLVFLLLDYPEYARAWPSFLPPTYREPIVGFLGEFDRALRRYFRGQAIIAAVVGILLAVGFSLIGLPMAVPFGLCVGLLNMVPYLQTVGLIPAMLLAMLRAVEGNSSLAGSVLLVLLVFGLVQLIQDALLTPRIMGKATGLRPVAILLGVFIWGKLLGFLGVLMAIPLTCLGIAYYRRYVLQQKA